MVTGQRGTSRAGMAVLILLALAAVEACGSRSPLVEDFGQGFAGEHESGGSGGSLGGTLGGGTGGGGYGGVGGAVGGNGYGGVGGDYPGMGAYPGVGGTYPGVGGAYPMGVGGTTPVAGYGGTGISVGGAYPSAGYGGVGVGGALPMGGFGGKGMGTGGKGGGDARVYKGCVLTCNKYESQCPELAGTCSDDCDQLRGLYPECSGPLGDYFFCLNENMDAGSQCSPDTCTGPGCFADAQSTCAWAVQSFLECLAPSPDPDCSASGEFFDQGCSIQTYCGGQTYVTKCTQIDAAEQTFECSCTDNDGGAATVLSGYDGYQVCYEMERQCGFPQVLAPL